MFDTNVVTGSLHLSTLSESPFFFAVALISFFFPRTAAKKKKQAKPLSFKVGMGKVIRGVSPAVALLV